jgi:gluconate 2-dehydrogenase
MPKILVSRRTFDPVIAELRRHFEVDDCQAEDKPLDAAGLRARLAGKDGALLFPGEPVGADILDAAPSLRVLALAAVGYNSVDIEACTARGILVTNTPGVLDDTTADMAWALMLAAARRVTEAERWLRAGKWTGMNFGELWGVDVHHATLGILGMGRIGRAIAKRASGFDMRVIYHNRTRLDPKIEAEVQAEHVSFDQLLVRSDFLCLVLPYTPENHHIIGKAQLARMQPSSILVNIARGGIVDDAALVEALREKRIAGAGLDVYEGEPKLNPGFLGLDNVVLAPHLGSATNATRLAMARLAARNLIEGLTGGKPPTPVNPEVLE